MEYKEFPSNQQNCDFLTINQHEFNTIPSKHKHTIKFNSNDITNYELLINTPPISYLQNMVSQNKLNNYIFMIHLLFIDFPIFLKNFQTDINCLLKLKHIISIFPNIISNDSLIHIAKHLYITTGDHSLILIFLKINQAYLNANYINDIEEFLNSFIQNDSDFNITCFIDVLYKIIKYRINGLPLIKYIQFLENIMITTEQTEPIPRAFHVFRYALITYDFKFNMQFYIQNCSFRFSNVMYSFLLFLISQKAFAFENLEDLYNVTICYNDFSIQAKEEACSLIVIYCQNLDISVLESDLSIFSEICDFIFEIDSISKTNFLTHIQNSEILMEQFLELGIDVDSDEDD